MKAAQLLKSNGKAALAIGEVEQPAIEAGKVLVEVHEAGVNPFDWKMRDQDMGLPLPLTLGNDFAGVVKDVGPGVEGEHERAHPPVLPQEARLYQHHRRGDRRGHAPFESPA